MSGRSGLRSGRRGGLMLALAAVVAGTALVVFVVFHQQSAPVPRSAGRIAVKPARSSSPTEGRREPRTPDIGRSRPVRIQIPSIGVDTVVNALGLAPDGSLAVPQPGPHLDQAAWFRNSPTPGQPGPSIIEGHVDSVEGESVFFRLGAVHPGDHIRVHRADGSVLDFVINAVRDFQKASFPTSVVYGGDLTTPQLRLITCSDFDETTHHHEGNEVVFSHLARVIRAAGSQP